MRTLKLLLFILPWLLLLIAIGIIVFKPNMFTPVPSNKERVLRDSVNLLQTKVDSAKIQMVTLNHRYDSLLGVDQQIIYRTRDKIRFIYLTSDPSYLDSIIRANWDTRHR